MTDIIVIVICLIILFVYLRTKEYDSPIGLVLIALVLVSYALRFFSGGIGLSFIWNTASWVYSTIMTATCVIALYFLRQKGSKKKIALLFVLYLISGFMQQLLFQWVFLDTVYSLSGSLILSVAVGTAYYSLFHTKEGLRFFLFTLFIYPLWAWLFMIFRQIVPLALSHAIIGTAYYVWIYKKDIIKDRSRILAGSGR